MLRGLLGYPLMIVCAFVYTYLVYTLDNRIVTYIPVEYGTLIAYTLLFITLFTLLWQVSIIRNTEMDFFVYGLVLQFFAFCVMLLSVYTLSRILYVSLEMSGERLLTVLLPFVLILVVRVLMSHTWTAHAVQVAKREQARLVKRVEEQSVAMPTKTTAQTERVRASSDVADNDRTTSYSDDE